MIFHPEGKYKVFWDSWICLLVLYSVIEGSFRLGFLDSPSFIFIVLDYIVTIFFGLDMIINFNTAYKDPISEKLIYDRRKISKEYFRFWFWIDLISTIPFQELVSLFLVTRNLQSLRVRFFSLELIYQ
jgi:hypothetical protein